MALFGKAEKMPETLAELTALCPDLVAQAKQEAIDSINIEAIKQETVVEAGEMHAAEKDRIIAIIGATLPEQAAKHLTAIIESGVTAEQCTKLGIMLTLSDSEKETRLKTDLLVAIKDSGAPNPGLDGQAKGKQFDAESDTRGETQEKIDTLIAEYRRDNPSADYRDALLAVSTNHPELFRAR